MAEARYFCPTCGSPDLRIRGTTAEIKIRTKLKGMDAFCELCGWQGKVEDLAGAVTSEHFYTIEKISAILIGVVTKHGAGPLCQAFELIGLLDDDDQEGRNFIMQNVSAAMVTAAFHSASKWTAVREQAKKAMEDEGERPCPQCNQIFSHPYVHACQAREGKLQDTRDITQKEEDDGDQKTE